MQAYALAVRELLNVRTGSGSDHVRTGSGGDRVEPSSASSETLKINSLRATLHFLDPNIETSLLTSLLEQEVCAKAIDDAMNAIASLEGLLDAEGFPPSPAIHCRMCHFRDLCPAGREWLRLNR